MPSLIPGYESDIRLHLSFGGQVYISCRQKDNKRDSDRGYSWIPVLGPLVGASMAEAMYLLLTRL
jgi:glycerol uptake facilitator-like aquaporin